MSTLTENVAKVKNAHAALKTAIEGKGVTVPAGTKLTGMPALVDQIQTGGGGAVEPTNTRAVFAYDGSSSIVVPNTMVVDMTAMTDLQYCFFKCTSLTSLTLPDGFGQNATNLEGCFNSCGKLKSLTPPKGFGQNATNLKTCFGYCQSLSSLVLPEGFGRVAENLENCFSNNVLKSLVLPDGFGQNATNILECFSYCQSLSSLVLPEGFGQNATNLERCFITCGLTSLTLPKGFGQNATSIGGCFMSDSILLSLTLPKGFGQNATDISYCFSYCQSLSSLVLPEGFGQNATNLEGCFEYCLYLVDITGNPKFKASLDLSPCNSLTHDSLMVVINGLQTVTETQTLTLGSTNLDKLTEEEKQVAIGKGWTLA